jgi:hypothetical protein
VWRATRRDPRFAIWPAMVAYAAGALFLEPLISLQTSGLLAITVGAVLSTARAPLAATRMGRHYGRPSAPMHVRLGV